MSEKREQVAKQCEVVAHLAKVLAELCTDRAQMLRTGRIDQLIELTGQRSACHMEILGDILNGMDAVTEEDNWCAPIFEEAHRLWPNAWTWPTPPPPAG